MPIVSALPVLSVTRVLVLPLRLDALVERHDPGVLDGIDSCHPPQGRKALNLNPVFAGDGDLG